MTKTLARIMSALVVLVFAGSALAQSSGFVRHNAPTAYQNYSDTVFRVCATNNASPCTTTPIYSDSVLATVISQTSGVALTADKIAKFYIKPGQYVIQWYSAAGGSGYYSETFQSGSIQPSTLGVYQGTTSVGITDTAFHALVAAASDVLIPANLNSVNATYRVTVDGVYTNAAASLLNAEVMLCQVSGCASGTVVAPAGCAVVTTNQANNLTNGQFTVTCTLVTTVAGASSTFMAKSTVCANLGAATSAALSCFPDTATAVSAAVDSTVNEFVNVGFKFSTSNAGNSAIAHSVRVEKIN